MVFNRIDKVWAMPQGKGSFWRELDEGQIHFRDRLQFELKSEFRTLGSQDASVFLQELYLFIPESLQINPQTYSREQFYLDESNLIRYKTPSLTFEQLLDVHNSKTPLYHIRVLLMAFADHPKPEQVLYELKMFGNIFRSTLREEVKDIIEEIDRLVPPKSSKELSISIDNLVNHIRQSREAFRSIKEEIEKQMPDSPLLEPLPRIDEFMSYMIENYLTGLLDYFRKKEFANVEEEDKELTDLLIEEGLPPYDNLKEEEILWHSSQMNKYFYEALALKNVRVETKTKHGAWIGMTAAGLAMLFYMTLFVWKVNTFGINSVPFVMLAVFFYIVKDRIKEGMKELYHKNAYRWFPDYSTKIESEDEERIGVLNESFLYVAEPPEDFVKFREEHEGSEAHKSLIHENIASETIMQYKKEIILYTEKPLELNTIFRFNIHKFVEKAGDAVQLKLRLNPFTREIVPQLLPKIYYLTLILKNTYKNESVLKKFRVVINKKGIENVHYLGKSLQNASVKVEP